MKNHRSFSCKTAQQIQTKSPCPDLDWENLVKITAPSADGIFARKRLYALLEKHKSIPVTWITAPAGSGKTSLITSYLNDHKASFIWYQCDSGEKDLASFFYYLGLAVKKTKKTNHLLVPLLTLEYLQNIKKYSRNYFETLYRFLEPGSFIIFDNFQEVASDSLLMELLAEAVENVPSGIRLFFVSRSYPPQSFARMQLNNQLLQIDGSDLNFNADELLDFITNKVEGSITPEQAETIHTGSQGWIAGVILLINQKNGENLFKKDIDFTSNDVLFNYFAGEIFEAELPDIQHFLVATAFLPEFTVAMAKEMSGNNSAADILHSLLRKNFFITSHHGNFFQYHPLFRQFLINRATQLLGTKATRNCMQNSAKLLVHVGKQDEAVDLFAKVHNYTALITLIHTDSVSFIERGQIQTVKSWISRIPEPLQEENPWVIYWHGVCHLPFDLKEAKRLFSRAHTNFQQAGDVPGIFSSWCGVVDSILHGLQGLAELDHWIDTLDMLIAKYHTIPDHIENQVTITVFMSLVFRKPDHCQFACWKEKALVVFEHEPNITRRIFAGFYLLSYSYWKGDFGMADKIQQEIKAMADSPNAQPLARITGYFVLSYNGYMTGDYSASLAAIKNGLDLSAQTGIVIWNYIMTMQGAGNCLSEGDADGADLWLDQIAAKLHQSRDYDIFYYHYTRAWQALIRRKPQKAFAHQQSAINYIKKSGARPTLGVTHFGMSQICHEIGDVTLRDKHLEEAGKHGELYQSHLLLFMVGLARAQYALDRGDTDAAQIILEQSMATGRREGYYGFSFWRGSVIMPLLLFCLKRGIEVKYTQHFIQKRNLRPPHPPVDIEAWPWSIRIYTFGQFLVVRKGEPLTFGKKASIKVLELLKAIISLGGRNVSEDRLSDYLWPDSDGDAAKQALASTLFRLRKWLGEKHVIIRSEGLLSLDPYSCWVDVWVLESLLKDVDHDEPVESDRIKKVLTMYTGDFLNQDTDKSWTILKREKFRTKLTRTLCTEAEQLRKQGMYEESIRSYQRGIERAPLSEEFYQGLMRNYIALGETTSALRTYEQLKTILTAHFDTPPSRSSQILLKTLIEKRD